jgi:hypothetical protein
MINVILKPKIKELAASLHKKGIRRAVISFEVHEDKIYITRNVHTGTFPGGIAEKISSPIEIIKYLEQI